MMNSIKVSKSELVKVLTANRAKHRKVVEEAWTGYLAEATRRLEAQVERARQGLRADFSFRLVMPADHTEDYDRALAMLGMSLDSEIELSEGDFRELVQDDWDWKGQWVTTNSAYTVIS